MHVFALPQHQKLTAAVAMNWSSTLCQQQNHCHNCQCVLQRNNKRYVYMFCGHDSYHWPIHSIAAACMWQHDATTNHLVSFSTASCLMSLFETLFIWINDIDSWTGRYIECWMCCKAIFHANVISWLPLFLLLEFFIFLLQCQRDTGFIISIVCANLYFLFYWSSEEELLDAFTSVCIAVMTKVHGSIAAMPPLPPSLPSLPPPVNFFLEIYYYWL